MVLAEQWHSAEDEGENGAPHTVKKMDDKRVQVNLHKSTCATFSTCMEENLCTFCKLDKSKRTRKINN